MTQELEAKLEAKHKHIQHSSYVGCGDGWFDLIDVLYGQLPKGTKIAQVKEKFGTLRVYVDLPEGLLTNDWGRANGAISMAEAMSSRLCEECGQPGQRDNKKTWVRTLCEKHQAMREE